MKTMMELLLRLQELERALARVEGSQQFTTREKRNLLVSLDLVKNTIPEAVLRCYDELKLSGAAVTRSPEVFAMAVLVSTYKQLSPRERARLVQHFSLTAEPRVRKRKKRLVTLKRRGPHQNRAVRSRRF